MSEQVRFNASGSCLYGNNATNILLLLTEFLTKGLPQVEIKKQRIESVLPSSFVGVQLVHRMQSEDPELLLNIFSICSSVNFCLNQRFCRCTDDVNSREATLDKSTGSRKGSSSAGEFCESFSATTFVVPATSCSMKFTIV
jgi:hypothetical protein